MVMAILLLKSEPRLVKEVRNAQYNNTLREPRMGVILHYDGSGSDAGSLAWFSDPACRVSYNLIVLDDGSYASIAPTDARAWHAGVCRSSDPARLPYRDANSAFYGIALATNGHVDVTPPQLLTAAWLTARLFAKHGWSRTSELYRVTTHSAEAWRRGRKTDPEGGNRRNPIMSADDVRHLLPMFQNVESL